MIALSRLGVTSVRLPGLTGVWVQSDSKAARQDRRYRCQGWRARGNAPRFALNVTQICLVGWHHRLWIERISGPSLAELDIVPTCEILEAVMDAFSKVFEYRMVVIASPASPRDGSVPFV
jgi:hypothetical protein